MVIFWTRSVIERAVDGNTGIFPACIIILYLHIFGLIVDPHNDLLPVGVVAQLVEHCTAIAEVRVRIPRLPRSCLSSAKMR